MTFRRVTQTDVPEVTAFLTARSEYVMFPLNNLQDFGLDGEDDYAPRMWRNNDGPLTDVLSITRSGMVMPYLPSADYAEAARVIKTREVFGFVRPGKAVRGVQDALGLNDVAMELDADLEHFKLDLADLVVPEGTTHIVPASENNRAALTEWMIDFHIGTLEMDADKAANIVPGRISTEIQEDCRVVLMQDDTAVATTAFNAALPHIVQIGGVYTPPEFRGQGHARRAVGLHLLQAREAGVKTATLFSNDVSAIAAYETVGFKNIGDWVLAILETPQVAP